jgi:hypothetical protein
LNATTILLSKIAAPLAHADSAIAFFERDLWLRDAQRAQRIRALVALGDPEQALNEVEYLLRGEYFYSLTPGVLRYHPDFGPLREHPRFQALMASGGADRSRLEPQG